MIAWKAKQLIQKGSRFLGLEEWLMKQFFKARARARGLRFHCTDGGIIQITKDSRRLILSHDHLVYSRDMIDHFDYYFNAVVPSRFLSTKGEESVVDYSRPAIHTLRESGVGFFFPSLAEGEDTFAAYCKKYLPKEGDVVFDCGAYCGVEMYCYSKRVGESGKVYAFEPDDTNFDALVRNVETHKLTNVVPIKKGIWSSTGVVTFNREGNQGSAISSIVDRGRGREAAQIETLSLADAYEALKLSRLDYVKMDIEGAEVEAINGSKDFIREHPIHFAIATHPQMRGIPTSVPLERTFREIGYVTETLDAFYRHGYVDTVTYAEPPQQRL